MREKIDWTLVLLVGASVYFGLCVGATVTGGQKSARPPSPVTVTISVRDTKQAADMMGLVSKSLPSLER